MGERTRITPGWIGAVVALALAACGDDAETQAWADFCPVYEETICEGRAAALPSCNWPHGPDVPGPCHLEALCWNRSVEERCEGTSWRAFCGDDPPGEPSPAEADACLADLAAADFTEPGLAGDRVPTCAALCD